MSTEMPIVLSIAGSDSGGGAGIQADLKTFAALGVHGCTAITAITAQDTRQVHRVLCLEPDLVGDQIEAIRGDFPVAATKLGMLGEAGIIERVAFELGRGGLGQVVLDPVMVASSGATLLQEGAVKILREGLLPQVDLITPNMPEASMLLGRSIADEDAAVEDAARELQALGVPAVLIKAGHRRGESADDLLMHGDKPLWLRAKRLDGAGAHGSGCSLSAAIAALLGRGQDLETACTGAKEYVRRGMEAGLRPGKGEGILHHFWEYYGREGLP